MIDSIKMCSEMSDKTQKERICPSIMYLVYVLVQEFRKNGRHFLESVIISGKKAANITLEMGRKEESV